MAYAKFQSLLSQISHSALIELDPALTTAVVQNACVRCVGVTEETIREIIRAHCAARGCNESANYIGRQLQNFYNPKVDKISALLELFSDNWAQSFRAKVTDEMKDALGSLVAQKNRIAHGDPTDISIARIRPWIMRARDVCEAVREIVV